MIRTALPFLLALALSLPAPAAPAGRVVLISIDGLRPEFYLAERDAAFPAPTLRRLAREGAHAKVVESVFPSVTYPAHSTMVTGVRPARHGVVYNTVWDPAFQRGGWYWFASDLKARTLWEAVREAKGTSAGLSWPVTVGAAIDWNIPEGTGSRPDRLSALRAGSTPGLVEEVEKAGGPLTPEGIAAQPAWDAFLVKAAAVILKSHRPHLMVIHLVQTDGAQHKWGREHPEVRAAVGRADEAVAKILAAVRDAGLEEETTLLITGDHGFIDIDRMVAPNALLREAGLIAGEKETLAWQAYAHISGAAAGVYVKEGSPTPAGEVEKLFRAKAAEGERRLFGVLSRKDLDALGAMPGAAFGLEAEPGAYFSGEAGPRTLFERAAGGSKGTHGYRPARPEMHTGLILWGRGVKRGTSLDRARLVDVAPTAARLLGASLPDVEGRVLMELLGE